MTRAINYKNKRLLFVGTIFLISLISLVIIINNFRDNIVFFYSPSEIEKIQNHVNSIRVGGMIKKSSINKIDSLHTNFTVTDYQNDLVISYRGILPDLFREEQGVVAKGHYDKDNKIFIAEELLVKHDENYMPPEVAKNLKMRVAE